VQFNLQKFDEAIDTLEERVQLFPKDAQKHYDSAAKLALIYQRDSSDKLFKRIYAFFERGLDNKMLVADQIILDNHYRDLLANPQFEKLVRKSGG